MKTKATGHLIDELWVLHIYEFGQIYSPGRGGFSSYEEMCKYCKDNDLDLVESFDYNEDEPNPPYIVCWVEKHVDPMDYNDVEYVDKYKPFIETPNNKYAAKIFYAALEEFIEDEERGVSLYSANLCEVIQSTDYIC